MRDKHGIDEIFDEHAKYTRRGLSVMLAIGLVATASSLFVLGFFVWAAWKVLVHFGVA